MNIDFMNIDFDDYIVIPYTSYLLIVQVLYWSLTAWIGHCLAMS